ncbi:MAG: glycerate kinase [Elusimicrobia bacterium]|nr:glycerate kinase [Elusimicrobiota bacterium]
MRILIALNAFKGTLTAGEAGAAAARAARRVCPGAVVEVLPIADGGDGLLEALRPALGGKLLRSRAEGPLGEKLRARWLLAGRAAVIEMAEASGLRRLGGAKLRPLDASTRGVGQLISAAALRGAPEIIVGLGGSASNDGGAGCAQACGFELLDRRGRPVARGARGLAELSEILPGRSGKWPEGLKVTGLADVKNPLCGRLGSARVFGPQKGAGPREVEFMEKALRNYARVVKKCLGREIARLPGGAAAGGLGAGLAAFFGAGLEDGSAFVLEKTGFRKKLALADLLITGEGCFDAQTFYGKAPGAALAAAAGLGKPAIVVCGVSLLKDPRELRRRGVAGLIEAGRTPSPAAAVEAAVGRELPGLCARIGLPCR